MLDNKKAIHYFSDYDWNQYLTRIEDTHVQNIDLYSWGEQAEYIDVSLNFNRLWDRINQYLNFLLDSASVQFNIHVSNLSLPKIGNLLAGILGLRNLYSINNQRISFDLKPVTTPQFKSLQILDLKFSDQLEEIWAWMIRNSIDERNLHNGFSAFEIDNFDQLIIWMRKGNNMSLTKLMQHQADFYNYYSCYDQLNQLSIETIFPELSSWLKECRNQAAVLT